jgi:hypothetical protein
MKYVIDHKRKALKEITCLSKVTLQAFLALVREVKAQWGGHLPSPILLSSRSTLSSRKDIWNTVSTQENGNVSGTGGGGGVHPEPQNYNEWHLRRPCNMFDSIIKTDLEDE